MERLVIMLILSMDRKKVMDCAAVSVEKYYGGGKDSRFALIGSTEAGTASDGVLAAYPDEKTAIDELEKIFAAFESGAKSYRL